jgi:PAS domain S-box-containing protein
MSKEPNDRMLDEKLCLTLVSDIRGIVWEADPLTGRVSFVSPHAERILGYPRQQWLNDPKFWRTHIHPDDVTWYSDYWNESSLKDEDHELRYRMIAADGRIVWLHDSVTVVRSGDGSVWLRGVMFDITERKKAEDALRTSEERLRAIFDTSQAGIVVIDPDGRISFANNSMAKMLSCTLAELIGSNYLNHLHPEELESNNNLVDQLIHNRSGHTVTERHYVRGDGTDFWGYMTCSSLGFVSGAPQELIAVITDITDKRRIQDEMIKSQKLESLGLLAGGIAHDFNNILTSILGNISYVRLNMDQSPLLLKRLEECEKAISSAGELTRQLLTFSRGGEPVKKLLSPAPLISNTASFALRGSNVTCVTELADDLWRIEADEGQLCQVLHNLILNAAQAMPNGGEVTVKADNELLGYDNPLKLQPGAYIKIYVTDHGCGIPRENLIRIFDPYFTTKPKGSGLGLASAYSIVKKHGGDLVVLSTVGEGTRFAIRLPASPGEHPEEEKIKQKTQAAGRGRILFMDDNEMIREMVDEILEHLGYEVESCADGREAVELFRKAWENERPFSAVILDLTVPGGMGGKEVVPLILEIDPDAVLIVSSGYSNDPVIANYRDFGFSGVIHKPYDADALGCELKKNIKGEAGKRCGQMV